jgi:Zn-dependent protease
MDIDTVYLIIALVIATVLHELAHGLTALALGDKTAKRAGRLTLNPLAHVDRMGTVMVPLILALGQLATIGRIQFLYGWARPVPVNPMALAINGKHNPRRLMAIVAVAGPAMNFVLALLGGVLLYLGQETDFLLYFILVNLVLGSFNLIPFPPFDGGRIAVGLLPLPAARWLAGFEKQGIAIILILLFVIPTVLAQFGVHFDPFHDAMGRFLPWAEGELLNLTGHGNGV